jgi:hypothetical protein
MLPVLEQPLGRVMVNGVGKTTRVVCVLLCSLRAVYQRVSSSM